MIMLKFCVIFTDLRRASYNQLEESENERTGKEMSVLGHCLDWLFSRRNKVRI